MLGKEDENWDDANKGRWKYRVIKSIKIRINRKHW